jgi:hypothetical protein
MKYDLDKMNKMLRVADHKRTMLSFLIPTSHAVKPVPEKYEGKVLKALEKYMAAQKKLVETVVAERDRSWKESQDYALGFLSQHTGQQLPGTITLDHERGHSVTMELLSMNCMFPGKKGSWSAQVRVKTDHCFTTETIVFNAVTKRTYWESDCGF